MVVALGVSGGIAAYKACEIVRGLDRAGIGVQVLLTDNGARFITPLTLQTLSRRRVLRDTFEATDGPTSDQPIAGGDGPAAVLGFDNPDFVYGYYVDRMLSAIRAQWLRPPVGNDVEMIVHFVIRQDGTVEDLEIVKSSQIRSFDLAGQRAVLSASPLPPLPRSYREPTLGVTLIIR